MKNQIYSNYKKFTTSKEIPGNLQTLDQPLGRLRRSARRLSPPQASSAIDQSPGGAEPIEAGRACQIQNSTDDRAKRVQQANAEILKRRVAAFQDLERSVRLVEGQLQSIENFFGLVNDQVVTLPTPERVSALHFEELSDSIALTKQMLEETADTFGMLDNQNRELDAAFKWPSSKWR